MSIKKLQKRDFKIITIVAQLVSLLLFSLILFIIYKSFNNNELFFTVLIVSVIYFLITSGYYFLVADKIFTNVITLLPSYLYASLPEELIKYLLYLLLFKLYIDASPKTKLLSALIFSLVFSTLETSFYLTSMASLLRLASSLPMHLLASFYMSTYRYGFFIALLIHTAYNILVSLNNGFSLLIIPLLIFLTINAIARYRRLFNQKENNKIDFF